MLSDLIGHFPYPAIFILLILGGVGLPFPEDATLMLTGFLISTEVLKADYAIPVVYAGLLIGDFILYSAGKKWGREIVTHERFHRILPPERFNKLEEMFERQGFFFILFGRHLIGFRAQVFLVSGIMRMPAIKFVLADAVSAIFTMTLMIGVGYIGGNSVMVIRKDITRIEHLAVLAAIALVLLYLLYKYIKNKRSEG